MESDSVRDQILADAIRTAIESEKKIQILKGIIGVLVGLLVLSIIAII